MSEEIQHLNEQIKKARSEQKSLQSDRESLLKKEASLKQELEILNAKVRISRGNQLLQILKDNPELGDLLAPEHSRTSCSDAKRQNIDISRSSPCVRCVLLEALTQTYWDDQLSFKLDIEFHGY